MSVICNLPKTKGLTTKNLANHLLTEQSGIAALDAAQGTILSKRIQTIETVHIRDKSYNNDKVVDMLHAYWGELKNGCYTVTLETSFHTWRANVYKHSNPYGDYMISSYSNVYQAPKIGKIFNGTWSDYGEVALKSNLNYNQYTLTVEGNENIFYPVVFPYKREYLNIVELSKYVSVPKPNSGMLRAKIEYTVSGWGGYPFFLKTAYYLRTKDFIANGLIGQTSIYNLILWLRGGTQYTITDNVNNGLPQIYYEYTNLSDRPDYPFYVEPRTTIAEQFQKEIQP